MIFELLTDIRTIFASIGLMLATASFISGLQLVRSKSRIELKIHRVNGYVSITLYTVLFIWYFVENPVTAYAFTMWLCGILLILTKLWIVKRRKKAFRYVSWMGATLVLIWLYLVFIHIPV